MTLLRERLKHGYLMPAFFERPAPTGHVPVRIFATPPDGENVDTGEAGWRCDQYYTMKEEAKLRIRYETPLGRK